MHLICYIYSVLCTHIDTFSDNNALSDVYEELDCYNNSDVYYGDEDSLIDLNNFNNDCHSEPTQASHKCPNYTLIIIIIYII